MRIGVFVELYRPYCSGVVVSVETMIKHLKSKGFEFVVLAPFVPFYQDEQEFKVIRLPSYNFGGYWFAVPIVTKKLLKTVRELKLDLIHIQGPYGTGYIGVNLSKKLDIPVIMTYHTDILQYLDSWKTFYNWPMVFLAKKFCAWWIEKLAQQCQLIIAPSYYIKNELEKIGVKKRIEVLPTGVEAPANVPRYLEARNQLGLPINAKIVTYVGRLAKEKNLPMLIEAFEYFCGANGGVKKTLSEKLLILVGDGPFIKTLKRLVRIKGLQNSVIFTKAVPRETVWKYLAASDVFAFPSTTETQGISVAEAMAVGLPIVVVNEGGAGELIKNGESGLIRQNDSWFFGEAIASLFSHEEFASFLGQNARQKVLEIHPENIYKKLKECYEEVCYAP